MALPLSNWNIKKINIKDDEHLRLDDTVDRLKNSQFNIEKIFQFFSNWHSDLTISARRLLLSITTFVLVASIAGADLSDLSLIGVSFHKNNLERLEVLALLTIFVAWVVYTVSLWADREVRAARIDIFGNKFKVAVDDYKWIKALAKNYNTIPPRLFSMVRDINDADRSDQEAYNAIDFYENVIKSPHRVRILADSAEIVIVMIFCAGAAIAICCN